MVDHPRRRGELGERGNVQQGPAGSSPQARGTLMASMWGVDVTGIIPAGAGNSPAVISPRDPTGDHPRRRGELSLSQ